MFRKHRSPVGAHPGTLVPRTDSPAPRVSMIKYSATDVMELSISDIAELAELRDSRHVLWVDVQGMGKIEVLQQIGELFGLHPLAMEDVINIPQRPKAEDYDGLLYLVSMMIRAHEPHVIGFEQISIFLGPGFVLSFQERYGDIFDPLRNRIKHGKGSIRKSGADYLAYAILDTVIDAYYPALEALGEYIEELETQVIEEPSNAILSQVHNLRRELLTMRRTIFPQRELLSALIRDENKLIKKSTRTYLRDCYDHCAQVIDVLETYREVCSGLMDLYLSGVSQKMNDVMKLLTIISTIFIPMSFLAGVYGMNFEHMPELSKEYAYPLFWVAVLSIATGMLLYFRHLGWIGGSTPASTEDRGGGKFEN